MPPKHPPGPPMTLGNMRESRSAPRSDDDAAVRLICTRFRPVLNYAWQANGRLCG